MQRDKALLQENEELKKVIIELQKSLNQKSSEIASQSSLIEELKNRIATLEKILTNFQREIFGRKSEKIKSPEDDLFSLLFNEAEVGLKEPEKLHDGHSETIHVESHSRKKRGRKPLPANLPREVVIHDISDSEKICNCGCRLSKIGEEISEQLVVIPARAVVRRHVRYKYACGQCNGDERDEAGKIVVTAPMPEQLLAKSLLTPEFFVYLIISKYLDSIPLYRIERILLRYGIETTRATLSNWIIGVYEKYKPFFEFMNDLLKLGKLIGIDETTTQVHNEEGRANTTTSYMWALRGGSPTKPIIIYIYRDSRSADFLREYLKGYKGIIQTDGYISYAAHFKGNEMILHVVCMAHIRRAFEKLWKSDKDPNAKVVLAYIRKLYLVEKEIRTKKLHETEDYSEIVKIRMEKAKPVFDALHKVLKEYETKIPPKTAMGQAVNYALGQWSKMEQYLYHGECYIDNNLVENIIRPFVLGRKNWLFMGCPQGAEASAFWFSIIQTFKANALEPFAALLYFIKGLPFCKNIDDCKQLFLRILNGVH